MLQLPEPFREVLVLRHLEGMPVNDVAAVTGVSEGTVKSRHFRALAKLRECVSMKSPLARPYSGKSRRPRKMAKTSPRQEAIRG